MSAVARPLVMKRPVAAKNVARPLVMKRPVAAKKHLRRIGDGVFRTIVQMAYEMEASERIYPIDYEEGMSWLKKNLPMVKKSVARHLRTKPRPEIYIPRNHDAFNNGYHSYPVLLYRHYCYHTPLYNAVSCHTLMVLLEGDKAFLTVKGKYWCSALVGTEEDGIEKSIVLPLTESCSVIERNVIKMLRSLNPFPTVVFP